MVCVGLDTCKQAGTNTIIIGENVVAYGKGQGGVVDSEILAYGDGMEGASGILYEGK